MEESKLSYGEGTVIPEVQFRQRNGSTAEKLKFDMDLQIIEEYKKAGTLENPEWKAFIEKRVNEGNYFIFIYFLMKFNENFLSFIDNEIIKKLELDLNFGQMSEIVFQDKYEHYVILNALTQSIDIGYKDFLNYVIEHEKRIPSAIVIKVLENEDVDLIRYIIDKKIILYEIETKNIFDQSKFPQIFFQKLDRIVETPKVKDKKNNFLTDKQLIYYLYKSEAFTEERRQYLIKELASEIHINDGNILPAIIKMKDQDLAEDLIQGELFIFTEETLTTALITSLKFNQSRVSFLLFQYSKVHIKLLKNKKLHRALIRSIIEYPENMEINLYMTKRLINYYSVADTIYMLSILEQLSFHKSIEDCKFLRFINPLKIFVLILELISITREITYQVKTKCDQLYDEYMKISTTYIDESTDKKSLEAIFRDKDFENREVVLTIAENNFLYLLKNPVVEHFIAKTWNSTYSSQSVFYHTSTLYHVIKSENVDMFKSHLANVPTRKLSEFKSFTEGFLIWKEGIKVKYYNQIFLFLFLLIFFQVLNADFMVSLQPKVELGITLRQTVNVWLPSVNAQFNGTNFTLTQINTYISENNATFMVNYLSKMTPEQYQNLTNIGNWITEMLDGIEVVKDKAVLLEYATYLYLIGILGIVLRYIYTKLVVTKVKIIDVQGILDTIIFVILVVRIVIVDNKFLDLFDFSKIDEYDDDVRKIYVFMMSGFFICLWLKTIVFFKFSDKIGPLIRIFELIMESLIYFGIIFISEFFIFGCIGNLLFALDLKNKDYKQLATSFLACFRATMNDFDFEDFDVDNINIAAVFLTIHLVLSGIILFNFLIAILSNVYEKFQKSSILLFHQEIILKKTELLPDKNYGALILTPFPLNAICLLFLPFYLCCTSKKKLRAINNIGLYIAYSPLYIVFLAVHITTQCIFFPIFIFKLLYHVCFEVCNKRHIIGQKNLSQLNKLKNSLYCFMLLLLSPFIFVYCMFFDLLIYTRCLFQDEDPDKVYFEEEELITPFILNKLCEIFDKAKTTEISSEDVIQDFTEEMKMSNENYDFRNVLMNANHKESLILIREYSIFVKFINKMRLKNNFREGVVNKSLFTRLIESNINYCRIVSMMNKSNAKNKKSLPSKIFPGDESGSRSNRNSLAVSQYVKYNETEENEDEDEMDELFDLQYEIGRSEQSKRNIISFSRLPKMFYQRLYMINLKDIKNTMDMIKSSHNFHQANQKIRLDMKIMRKQLLYLSLAINAKEKVNEQKKSRASIKKHRASQVFNKMSFLNLRNLNPEEGMTNTNLINKRTSKRLNVPNFSTVIEE